MVRTRLVLAVALLSLFAGEAFAQTLGPTGTTGVAEGAGGTPAVAVRTRTFGKVTDIDYDGDVKIETDSGDFHVTVSPDEARMLKDGDSVTVEVLITPPVPDKRW